MSQARTQRIEAEIQRELATLIVRELKDPRVGNVTVTQVSVSRDMSTARVFFTPFAGQHSAAEAHAGLTHAAGFLRGEVGRRLKLRHAPRLEFLIDDSAENAARLTQLINRAVADDRAAQQKSDAPNESPPSGESAPR